MAYTQFDPTKPIGTDTGPQVPITANANDKALRDAIITGQMHGFAFSASGGTARQPQYMLWKNGTLWLRAALTWGSTGGNKYNIVSALWQLSTDSGVTYFQIDAQTFSFDVAGNLTATTAAGGFTSWLMSLIGRVGVAEDNVTTLLAAVAALGTLSTQNANAAAITGGYAELDYEREKTTVLGNLNTTVDIDWKLQGFVVLTVTGADAAFTYVNLPPGGNGGRSQFLAFKVTNGGIATNLFGSAKRPAGFGLSSSGVDWVSLACVDGFTPEIVGVGKAVG